MELTHSQAELYRRLGDYVRLGIERGVISADSTIGVAYRDCVQGGCPVVAPAQQSASPHNSASLAIAAREAVECWNQADKVDFSDFAIRMNRLEAALLQQA